MARLAPLEATQFGPPSCRARIYGGRTVIYDHRNIVGTSQVLGCRSRVDANRRLGRRLDSCRTYGDHIVKMAADLKDVGLHGSDRSFCRLGGVLLDGLDIRKRPFFQSSWDLNLGASRVHVVGHQWIA